MRFQVVTTASVKMSVFRMLRRVVPSKLADVSKVLTASIIAIIMKAVKNSETSANFVQTL
jgi:hypothetical protein